MRSQIAFARGAPGGLVRGLDVVRGEDRVERPAESGVAVPEEELEGGGAVGEVHEQVAGGLGGPCPGRVRAHPEQMCSAGVMLDRDQDVDPPERDGVYVQEVHGQDGLGLCREELGQVGPDRRGAG
ncbi:MAG: hypothetical protein LC808_07425, partial [Actinobacteria bacterium]|nr:hypothetical protein [Actinomycetota bacterium]